MFTDDILRALLAVGRHAVGEVVACQFLVAGDPGAFENRERRRSSPMWTSLGAKPVTGLTEIYSYST